MHPWTRHVSVKLFSTSHFLLNWRKKLQTCLAWLRTFGHLCTFEFLVEIVPLTRTISSQNGITHCRNLSVQKLLSLCLSVRLYRDVLYKSFACSLSYGMVGFPDKAHLGCSESSWNPHALLRPLAPLACTENRAIVRSPVKVKYKAELCVTKRPRTVTSWIECRRSERLNSGVTAERRTCPGRIVKSRTRRTTKSSC